MSTTRLVIPGPPRGKGVARVTRFGTFIPAASRAEMEAVRYIGSAAMQGRAPISGPIELRIAAYLPIPVSWSRRDRAAALANERPAIVKPDASNIQKLIEDGMNHVVFTDDSQIVRWQGWKLYAAEPRVVVEVVEL